MNRREKPHVPPADWWHRICVKVQDLQKHPGYIETSGNHSRNEILKVDEAAGYIELFSRRSRSGTSRRISRSIMSPSNPDAARANGAMVRTLWELINKDEDEDKDNKDESAMLSEAQQAKVSHGRIRNQAAGETWDGALQIGTFLAHCLDEDRLCPKDEAGLLLVSRKGWQGAPDLDCDALALSSIADGASLRVAVGGLLAELVGLAAVPRAWSGGAAIRAFCGKHRTSPLDLYLSWMARPACVACAARRWSQRLRPLLDLALPSCQEHSAPTGWAALWGAAGQADAEEIAALNEPILDDPALLRALR